MKYWSKLGEKIEFLYQFLDKPETTGSIIPSSKYLASKVLSFVDFDKKDLVIIEYGPGTGPFTSGVIKELKKGDKLIVIELNNKFAADLKEKYKDHKNVKIYEDNVSNSAEILKIEKIKKVDYIISGIPFSSIPKKITDDILECTKEIMNDKALFITFQYSKFKQVTFEKYFKILETKFVLRNVPAAYVFCMKKL